MPTRPKSTSFHSLASPALKLLLVVAGFATASVVAATGCGTSTAKTGASGPTGVSAPVKPTGKALCSDDAGRCAKWKTRCDKDCQVLPEGTYRDECTANCDDKLPSCQSACEDSADPETFDPLSDWADLPERPKAFSSTCGGRDQLVCSDLKKYDECQPELIKASASAGSDAYCLGGCTKPVKQNSNPLTFTDDCDASHLCNAVKDAGNVCAPSACTPGQAGDSCSFPLDRCVGPFAKKPEFGVCDLTCRTEVAGTCPSTKNCYPYLIEQQGSNYPVNVCVEKTGTLQAIGAACTLNIQIGQTGVTSATDNCVADALCATLQASGGGTPSAKCYKNCWNKQTNRRDDTLCGEGTTCQGVGMPANALNLPQGGQYLCVPNAARVSYPLAE